MAGVVARAHPPATHTTRHYPPPLFTVRVNEADAFANEEGGENDDFFDFDDIADI